MELHRIVLIEATAIDAALNLIGCFQNATPLPLVDLDGEEQPWNLLPNGMLELPDDLSLRRRSSGKQCSAQSTPPRHGQGAHRQQRGLSLRVEPSSTRQARLRDTPASLSSDRALLETMARLGVQPPLCARPRGELGCEGVHPTHQH